MRRCTPLLASLLLVASAIAPGCATDQVASHRANPQLQREIERIIQAVRIDTGSSLLGNLRRLIAYDVFAVEQVAELAHDPNPRLRGNALFVLSQILDPAHPVQMATIDSTLEQALDDPDPQVQFEAVTGLAARGEWSVVPRLIDGLEHADAGVRYRCHQQLVATTSRDFGYSVDAVAEERQRSIEAWRGWYAQWRANRG